jgi:hypothetical protein
LLDGEILYSSGNGVESSIAIGNDVVPIWITISNYKITISPQQAKSDPEPGRTRSKTRSQERLGRQQKDVIKEGTSGRDISTSGRSKSKEFKISRVIISLLYHIRTFLVLILLDDTGVSLFL